MNHCCNPADNQLATGRSVPQGPAPIGGLAAWMRHWLGLRAPEPTLETAVAALMTHAASVHGAASRTQMAQIEALLREYFQMDAATAHAVTERAQWADDQAADLHGFARIVARLEHDDRLVVFRMVVQVVLADAVDAEEAGYLRLLGGLLGISDHERAVLQQRLKSEAQRRDPPSPISDD